MKLFEINPYIRDKPEEELTGQDKEPSLKEIIKHYYSSSPDLINEEQAQIYTDKYIKAIKELVYDIALTHTEEIVFEENFNKEQIDSIKSLACLIERYEDENYPFP
jgi:hypothetical protein